MKRAPAKQHVQSTNPFPPALKPPLPLRIKYWVTPGQPVLQPPIPCRVSERSAKRVAKNKCRVGGLLLGGGDEMNSKFAVGFGRSAFAMSRFRFSSSFALFLSGCCCLPWCPASAGVLVSCVTCLHVLLAPPVPFGSQIRQYLASFV